MDALKQPTIRVVAIIAEGVPEQDTKKLIAYARANRKVGIYVLNVVMSESSEIWREHCQAICHGKNTSSGAV
jgi:succinyl-CoA synthetase alpha subunit